MVWEVNWKNKTKDGRYKRFRIIKKKNEWKKFISRKGDLRASDLN